MNNSPVTIGDVYGPNSDDYSFFHNFFSLISNLSNGSEIVRGDFNNVIDPSLDKSKNRTNKLWQSTKTIKQFMMVGD